MMNYKLKTTFWMDFTIADIFGTNAIKETFDRAFNEWKSNYIYITELCMVLNWKIFEHYEKGNHEYGLLYDELWKKVDSYCCDNLKDEELKYFCKITD